MMMDHYSLEKLSQQRIDSFQREAAQRRLAREARGDEAHQPRIPARINVFAVGAFFARLRGLTAKSASAIRFDAEAAGRPHMGATTRP